MSEQPEAPAPSPEPSPSEEDGKKKKKKDKDKVRSAWISFTGRIVAQILGAVATIVLGLLIARQYQQKSGSGGDAPVEQRTARASRARSPGIASLAVLPLQNLSADPRQEYFADGLTEALITELSHIDRLRVISRTSSMHYKGQRKPLLEIAQELGVDLIVEGSVIKAGGRVRVNAQLIDAKTDEHIWARIYDRELQDVLSIQGDVATAIAREVKVALTPKHEGRLDNRRPVDPAVYDLYLLGRHDWNLRTAAGFQDAIRYFEQAVQKDPGFALAHAGLANTYNLLGTSVYGAPAPRDAIARAKAAAERAIALDDGLAEAHNALAFARYRYDWDWAAADREFRRALELNPGYVTGHQWYAIYLSEQGRDREATAEAERAVALDPLSAVMHMTLGRVHYNARRFDLAAAAERRALEIDTNFVVARLYLAWILLAQGNARSAIDVCLPAVSSQNPQILATLACANARAGEQKRGDAIRQQLLSRQPVSAAALVRLHACTGDPNAALEALDRAVAERSDFISSLKVGPLFDTLRAEPRFAALLNRLKLQ